MWLGVNAFSIQQSYVLFTTATKQNHTYDANMYNAMLWNGMLLHNYLVTQQCTPYIFFVKNAAQTSSTQEEKISKRD